MNTYGNVLTCRLAAYTGGYDTCAWEGSAKVRTYGDFLLLADTALKIAYTNADKRWTKFDAAVSKEAVQTLERQKNVGAANLVDSKGARYFLPPSTGTPVASLFARLKKLVVVDPNAVALVTAKASEYYTNVELATGKDYKAPVAGTQRRGPGVPAAPAAPTFQPSTPYAPPAPVAPPAPPAPPDAPFYQREWFAPVAVVAGLGLAAFFLLPKRA